MNPYIQSLRLRTLPLSMSGIVVGCGLAWTADPRPLSEGKGVLILALALLTAVSLQVLSNLCNELGDAEKGTDAGQQGRAAYGLQAGTLTKKQMIGMIAVSGVVAALLGIALIWVSFGSLLCAESLVFIGLGALALAGAATYTLGRHSYGYHGLGDLGVLVFFGLVATCGSHYLMAHSCGIETVLAGLAIGLPCVGVLNLNNIRDHANDRLHGKHTVAGLLGPHGSRIYHTLLLAVSLVICVLLGRYWPLVLLPLWTWHTVCIWRHEGRDLDSQMPVLMFSTLAEAVLMVVG